MAETVVSATQLVASDVNEEKQEQASVSDNNSDIGDEEKPEPEARVTHIGVRYFSYRGFTNRIRNDEWDHIFECLMIGANPREEMLEEIKRSEKIDDPDRTKPTEQTSSPALMSDRPDGIGENRHLFKVRIRSVEVLRHLAELSDWSADLGSASKEELVFCRPSHAFYFYHSAMKERLASMEPRLDSDNENETEQNNSEEVSYEEISFLFRPGELIFVPPSRKTVRAQKQSAIQSLFRGYFCVPLDVWYQPSDEGWKDPSNGRSRWKMYCYDYDGEVFRTAWHTLSFDYFQGEREITSLTCYPLKFHPQRDRILQEHVERGRQFKDISQEGVRHLYYSGLNLVTGIFEGEDMKVGEPEYVESEVIIDIKEAERHVPELWYTQEGEQQDNGVHATWLSRLIMRADGSHYQEASQFHEKNSFFRKDGTLCFKDWGDADLAILPRRFFGYVLRERRFMRLNVQNLQSKAENDRVTLDDIQIKDTHRKIVRSSVSSHFLRNARNRSDSTRRVYDPDIIRGKGRGLVMLLHGAPGVGKTATAEAVALEFNKPLFPITCGDLGITPDAFEETLKRIFRYAHLWDCILLLDEADVFLTQRDRFNIERNALVSVFLRVLEYYSGILFLTTNRVGALDEAFRSRVHVSLYYPHLSFTDTEAILCNNLKRLPRADALPEDETPGSDYIQVMDREIIDFIKDEYQKHYQTHRGPWNGRQIRNAVQIASCIAFHDQKGGRKNLPAVLTREHFKTVHETMTEFDGYMAKAQRVDQAKMAHIKGVRYDRYGEDDVDQEPVEYEGYGGQAPDPRYGNKYSAGRGGMNASSRGRTVPRPGARQQPSRGYATPPPPETYRSRGGQAPYHATSQSYGELHYEEEHVTFQGEPQAGRLRPSDSYAGGQLRVPQRRRQIDPQEEAYLDHSDRLSEWADENEQFSGLEDDQQNTGVPISEWPTQPLRDQPLDQHNMPPRSISSARAHQAHEKQVRYRQMGALVPSG
ncbi:uncharacterized protein KD926_011281 [Aspergillus affinis]|uniref:uncharacterized protein n=1 Tax=Aspergillus affinis TaxID=1070780 RepID=UPI0022FF18FD|nr:uncharacterized protein KD926_011281 [Aspergillus affinis]KAI9038146.1 hypothetical protein KD926_011281 [Aspergillus affinis]